MLSLSVFSADLSATLALARRAGRRIGFHLFFRKWWKTTTNISWKSCQEKTV